MFKLSYKTEKCKYEMGAPQKASHVSNLLKSNGSALSVIDYVSLKDSNS